MKTKYLILTCVVSTAILILIPNFDIYAQPDSHDGWVAECKAAHAAGYSWSLCSGFWHEPDPSDIPNPCVWHPSENPETIPHGSILAGTEGEPPIIEGAKWIIFPFWIAGWGVIFALKWAKTPLKEKENEKL